MWILCAVCERCVSLTAIMSTCHEQCTLGIYMVDMRVGAPLQQYKGDVMREGVNKKSCDICLNLSDSLTVLARSHCNTLGAVSRGWWCVTCHDVAR